MEIKITEEQINQMLVDAIMGSKLGEIIKSNIALAVKGLEHGYDNPVKKAIDLYVAEVVRNVIRDEYRDLVTEKVKERLAAKSDEFIEKALDCIQVRTNGY